jgi:hypothetical protein
LYVGIRIKFIGICGIGTVFVYRLYEILVLSVKYIFDLVWSQRHLPKCMEASGTYYVLKEAGGFSVSSYRTVAILDTVRSESRCALTKRVGSDVHEAL